VVYMSVCMHVVLWWKQRTLFLASWIMLVLNQQCQRGKRTFLARLSLLLRSNSITRRSVPISPILHTSKRRNIPYGARPVTSRTISAAPISFPFSVHLWRRDVPRTKEVRLLSLPFVREILDFGWYGVTLLLRESH
jgi:hypothetical protein